MKKNMNKMGFTLVEMMLVVAIIVMFAGITLTVSSVKLHDYQLKTEIYLQNNSGFEAGAFDTMSHLHDNELPPLTTEAVANDVANDANVAASVGNVENFNSMQTNVNGKEAALMAAISNAIGTDDFFCEGYHDTTTNTKTLYIYVGDMDAITNSEEVSVAIINYAQQHGEFLWAATGEVQLVQAHRNEDRGYVVQNHTVSNLTYTNTYDSTVAPISPSSGNNSNSSSNGNNRPTAVVPTTAPTNTPRPTVAPTNTPRPVATNTPAPTNTPVPTVAPTNTPRPSSGSNTVSTNSNVSANIWNGGGQVILPRPANYSNYSQIVYVVELENASNIRASGGWNYTNYTIDGNIVTITIDNPNTDSIGVQFNGNFSGATVVSITGTLK